MQEIIKIHPNDSVAVALKALTKEDMIQVGAQSVTLLEDIPQGHKFALKEIKSGEAVIKYGSSIGIAKEDIKEALGRSPDYADMLMMRMYFELVKVAQKPSYNPPDPEKLMGTNAVTEYGGVSWK